MIINIIMEDINVVNNTEPQVIELKLPTKIINKINKNKIMMKDEPVKKI